MEKREQEKMNKMQINLTMFDYAKCFYFAQTCAAVCCWNSETLLCFSWFVNADGSSKLSVKVCVVSVIERGNIRVVLVRKPLKTQIMWWPKICGIIIKLICANLNVNWRWREWENLFEAKEKMVNRFMHLLTAKKPRRKFREIRWVHKNYFWQLFQKIKQF